MPTCTTETLSAQSGFGLASLNDTQFKAAMIYLKVLELAAIGGTNYVASMNGALIDDSIALVKQMSRDQRNIAMLTIQRNNAIAAGASVPATPNALNEATGCCFQNYPDLDAILLLLECRLGVHKAYPQ